MRVLSGLQPSGQLHLGNYFGSLLPNLEMAQEAEESFLFIADLHALTTVQDPEKLRKAREDIILDYLACGFDPKKSTIFYQSEVPEHTELMWLLSVVTPMGLLERAVSYKEKVEKGIAASVGLFTYPVLMAADILLYDIDKVPVGKDQKQHLEMTRDIAIKFNSTFGETFKIPEPQIREDSAVVPGTDGQKMSKSYGNTIPLFGDEKLIKKAIMGIVTDSKGVEEPKDPDASIMYQLHALFLSEEERVALATRYRCGGLGYGEAKTMLFEVYMRSLAAQRKRRDELANDPAAIRKILDEGATRARETAGKTLARAKKAVGLL